MISGYTDSAMQRYEIEQEKLSLERMIKTLNSKIEEHSDTVLEYQPGLSEGKDESFISRAKISSALDFISICYVEIEACEARLKELAD
jgi:hypothetical protein